MFLYLTADEVGAPTGGGVVTTNELHALRSLGPTTVYSRKELNGDGPEPWKWDDAALQLIGQGDRPGFELAHLYAGTFGKTIEALKKRGTKIVQTIAAHDRAISKREHEALGIAFDYPHLVQEALWQRYISGYRAADVIVCPGTVPVKTVREYGPDFENKRIEIIPHGCELPEKIKPLPTSFVVGYLGSFGCDKGVRYLLEAWKKLAYTDAVLVLAGRDSASPFADHLVKTYGGGNIIRAGWQKNVSDFYNSLSLYVQPSCTEGFGIEVLESMIHSRPVLCSEGAGAVDLVGESFWFNACDADDLNRNIEHMRLSDLAGIGSMCRSTAEAYTWEKVREKYITLWKELLT